MIVCGSCGGLVPNRATICGQCGALVGYAEPAGVTEPPPVPARPPQPTEPPRRQHRTARMVLLAAAALVAVVGGVVLVAWASGGAGGPAAGGATGTPAPTSSGPAPLVRLGPGVSDTPVASEVSALLEQYFTAINDGGYEQWLATLTERRQVTTRDTFHRNYATTVDDDVVLKAVTVRADGTVVATATFRSRQDPANAPANLRVGCLRWTITYPLVREGGKLKIPALDPSNSSYVACPGTTTAAG